MLPGIADLKAGRQTVNAAAVQAAAPRDCTVSKTYLDAADRSWPVLRRAMGLHTFAYRATKGRVGYRIPGVPAPILLLDHVGAKSGVKRTSPLSYIADGNDVVLIAAKGGYPKHPAWLHNLKANPDTIVQIRSERRPVHARIATPEERERLWPIAVGVYQGYETYQRRTEREIPLVILEPRTAGTASDPSS